MLSHEAIKSRMHLPLMPNFVSFSYLSLSLSQARSLGFSSLVGKLVFVCPILCLSDLFFLVVLPKKVLA